MMSVLSLSGSTIESSQGEGILQLLFLVLLPYRMITYQLICEPHMNTQGWHTLVFTPHCVLPHSIPDSPALACVCHADKLFSQRRCDHLLVIPIINVHTKRQFVEEHVMLDIMQHLKVGMNELSKSKVELFKKCHQ